MAQSPPPLPEQIFAIDIGATNIKYCHVDGDGELLRAVRRRPTPYPCTPERLVAFLVERVLTSGCARVGIGFPGEFRDGRVVRPGNLSRPGGVSTEVDPDLEARWRGFELQSTLREATARDVRVVNDATMAALGCCEGRGVELVLTLGTGLGLALCRDGVLEKVRDVGAEIFVGDQTYDQMVGEKGRAAGDDVWNDSVRAAVARFVAEFGASIVHLAGGNARRVSVSLFHDWPARVIVEGNEAPLHGAARLFDETFARSMRDGA
ncbi:MAG TPA: ROK family protein [Acidimicrobiales bacterium]|nr:ROK family protein [Acidimicrobiales bacterium]